MEDLALALVTIGAFVFLFVAAIFADRAAGTEGAAAVEVESFGVPMPARDSSLES